MPLCPRPQPEEQLVEAAFTQKVRIAVTREAASAIAYAEDARLHAVRLRYLQLSNVRLVIAKALVFRGVLSSQLDRHAGIGGHVDHDLVYSLGVHVNFDCSAATGNGFEQRLPEGITSFRNSALPVHPQREPLNLWARMEQDGQRIAAIRRMRLRCEALDAMMCLWAIRPLISMCPESELELQPTRARLCGDKTQHLQILFSFVRGKGSKVLLAQL